ncbi:MAG: TetR/AcrR family transcriptional regulator [Aristaeellaceae bacterium]
MPPKCRFTREQIIQAALDMTRKQGMAALTARGLAAELDCSAKPIFGLFRNMEEVQAEVVAAANTLYQSCISRSMAEGRYPPYKASGMAYIQFARDERELFKLLFMRDRTGERFEQGHEELEPILNLLMDSLHLDREQAYLFHLELWLSVHGIATMIATNYVDWDMAFVSRALTDAYEGLKLRYTGGK